MAGYKQPQRIGAQRIGILGGAFDPPHLAHRTLAQVALAQLGLDALHVIPTGQAWHKARPLTDAGHRLAMCKLAFEGLGGEGQHVIFDEREIRRQGPSYTIDTLRELKTEYANAEFFLIMGQDQMRALPTWNHWQDIAAMALICWADRDLDGQGLGWNFEPTPELRGHSRKLAMPLMDLSSTGIRAQIGASIASRQTTPLVSPAVARYIADHHLYQPT